MKTTWRRLTLMTLTLGAACTSKEPASAGSSDSARAATALPTSSAHAAAAAPAVPGDSVITSPEDGAVSYYTAADLDRVAGELSRGTTTGRTLGRSPNSSWLQIRRVANGTPEIHDRWTDLTIVQAGHGTLLSGGQVQGSHPEADGEHRGGTITGGTQRPVGPGDLMRIPAGVPHQYLIQRGDSLRYVTIKILKS